MSSPYSGLPDDRFWSRAVAGPAVVDPLLVDFDWITPTTRVATAGSCFAQRIGEHLRSAGFSVMDEEPAPPFLTGMQAAAAGYGLYSARYGNIYTPRQFLQLLYRAYDVWQPVEDIWVRPDGRLADPFRPALLPGGYLGVADLHRDREQHFAAVRRVVERSEVLVFTLGLVEAWASVEDGAIFPSAPGVSAGNYNADSYQLRVFRFHELREDLDVLIDFLRVRNPELRLILTVSPVPLTATAQDRHVLVASTAAKATLRAVADEVAADWGERVEYFPSFEIVTGPQSRGRYFEENLRTVTAEGVAAVMSSFDAHFCRSSEPAPTPGVTALESRRSRATVATESLDRAPGVSPESAKLAADLCDDALLDRFASSD